MPDLRRTRTRLNIALAVLVLINVAAAAMLMTPLAGRESLRQDELRQLWLKPLSIRRRHSICSWLLTTGSIEEDSPSSAGPSCGCGLIEIVAAEPHGHPPWEEPRLREQEEIGRRDSRCGRNGG